MHQITGYQIAAARSLLGLSQITFAGLTNIEVISLIDIDACAGPAIGMKTDIIAVITELEREGIVFIDPNGSGNGIWLDGELW